MSIVIRDVREHELDSILALNNAAGPTILPLDTARIRRFFETAEYFRVAERDGALAGFLVGLGSDAEHDSSNFHWFRAHCDRFFYIDRIVVASRRRGQSVARVITAVPLSAAQEQRLTAVLGRIYGRTIGLQVTVDPSVLGGLVVQVGDEVIDGSIAHRLEAAQRRLAG